MNETHVPEILRALAGIRDLGLRFSREIPEDAAVQTTFSRWSASDVLHHLTAWLSYSRERLTGILDNAPVKDIDDLESFNRDVWEGGRTILRCEIPQRFSDEIGRYRDTVTRFSIGEFDRTDLPTGFDWPLWKYILLDTAVHPGWHFVYHGITRRNYAFASDALNVLAPAMLIFSGGDGSVFDLSELANDPEELKRASADFSAAFPDNPHAQEVAARNRGLREGE